ncbi:hypothetical protein [Nostoc sp.]|uniref:hypothetical protein n=1 Tax=Nostoc sp. TaxID=1180 RepID=UPI002FF6114A
MKLWYYLNLSWAIDRFRLLSLIRQNLWARYPFLLKLHNRYCNQVIIKFIDEYYINNEQENRYYLAAIPHATTGIGHAFSEWNTGRIIAQYCGLKFVHISLPDEWEKYLNLQKLGIPLSEVRSIPNLRVITLPLFDYRECDPCLEIKQIVSNIRSSSPILFLLTDGQNLYDHNFYLSDLRGVYLKSHKPNLSFSLKQDNQQTNCINVCVHIRRGDIVNMMTNNQSNWQERYVTLDYFDTLLKMMTEILADYQVAINIYSQGNNDEFQKFMKYDNVKLYINYDQFKTLNHMVFSDILIMSPSGFSYLAGLLSKGFKIARYPWWHEIPDQEDWYRLVGETQKNFDGLKSRLLNFIEYKI